MARLVWTLPDGESTARWATDAGVPGSGTVSEITSTDNSVTITDPTGPTVDLSVNGGSIPVDILTRSRILFTETPGAGTYTAEIVLPAAAKVIGISGFIEGVFDADTAELTVGDTANPGGYYDGIDLAEGSPVVYDAANPPGGPKIRDLTPGTGWSWMSTVYGKDGEDNAYNGATGFYYGGNNPGVGYPAGDTITVTLITTGTGGSSGLLQLDVFGWGCPVGLVDAVKS